MQVFLAQDPPVAIPLSSIDALLVVLYIMAVLGIGVWSYRRTALNLRSYFLGDQRTPWWALAMSGSVSNFDVAGTIWLVSVVMALGMRSFWVFWTFAFLNSAVLMSFMGTWIRRTRVLTATELIYARFGDDAGGRTARCASALMAVMYQTFAIGYAFVGVGKFASVYLPLSETQCSLLLIGVTTVYVIVGGFRCVIVTDVVQALLLNVGGLVVAVIAYFALDPVALHAKLEPSFMPPWTVDNPGGASGYLSTLPSAGGTLHYFLPMCLLWVFNGLVLSFGGTGGSYGEQRYLAARSGRDAALAGAGWGCFLVLRFAMVAGVAFLALVGDLEGVGLSDHEKALPVVIRDLLPDGVRGLLIVGLLAAFMSTFSSTINSTVSILTRDLVQPIRRDWSERRLVVCSYGMTVGLVLLGVTVGTRFDSVARIWEWIIIGLMATVGLPNVMRWYWWRLNGWGYATGIFFAMALSLVGFVLNSLDGFVSRFGEIPAYVYGPVLSGVAAFGCLFGSLLSRPVSSPILERFYRDVRPKGLWGPVQSKVSLSRDERNRGVGSGVRMLFNACTGMLVLCCFYALPVYLVGHWHLQAMACLAVAGVGTSVLYFTWYRRLESDPTDTVV